jgi:hypothetical protein
MATNPKEIGVEFAKVALPAIETLTALAKPDAAEHWSKEQRAAKSKAARDAFAAAHRKAEAANQAYLDEQWAAAAALRRQDPPDPTRVERLLEADQLARTVTTRTEAKNTLLPEGFAAIRRGDWRRAEMFMMAARAAHASTQALEDAIDFAKDADPAFPNRQKAIDMAAAAQREWGEQIEFAAQARTQVAYLTGNLPAAAKASINAKMAAYRQAQETGEEYSGPVGLDTVTPLPEPPERLANGNRMVPPSSGPLPEGGLRETAVSRVFTDDLAQALPERAISPVPVK